jgi:hypothetical protein
MLALKWQKLQNKKKVVSFIHCILQGQQFTFLPWDTNSEDDLASS